MILHRNNMLALHLKFDEKKISWPASRLVRRSFNEGGSPERIEGRRLVGVVGLEPTASCSQSTRASQLRHTPLIKFEILNPKF